MIAVLLVSLLGFAAIAIDIGHARLVSAEIQHAADAAALAGATAVYSPDFDDTVASARLLAQEFAAANEANGSAVDDLDLNAANDANGDIVVGEWDFGERTFEATTDGARVNAVQVRTARASERNTAVSTYLGQLLGVTEMSVRASAIAASGGPACVNGFPLALPRCGVLDSNGDPLCNGTTLRFANDRIDNAGLTGLTDESASTQDFRDIIDSYDPDAGCTVSADDTIRLNNGTPITALRGSLNSFLAQGPVTVFIPIIGPLSGEGTCELRYNNLYDIEGFVAFELTAVGYAPDQYIEGRVLCGVQASGPAGSEYFGLAAQPRLVD